MYQSGQTEAAGLATNQVTNSQGQAILREQDVAIDNLAAGKSGVQYQTLGVCWIVYGILRLALGICLLVYSGTATVMFGALLGRVPDAFSLMADFHFIYAVIVMLSFVCALFGIVAGVALLANSAPARKLALAAAIFSVSEIPFGTTLGIFTLIALLPSRGSFAPVRA
jgi:hypothetical protein